MVAKVDDQYKQEVSQQQQQIVSVLSFAVHHDSNLNSCVVNMLHVMVSLYGSWQASGSLQVGHMLPLSA